jgi:hypothetical protein
MCAVILVNNRPLRKDSGKSQDRGRTGNGERESAVRSRRQERAITGARVGIAVEKFSFASCIVNLYANKGKCFSSSHFEGVAENPLSPDSNHT